MKYVKKIPLNEWIHIAAIYNGKLDIHKNTTINLSNSNGNMYIGYNPGRQYENKTCFDGIIDDVRIYNRALTEPEIIVLFEWTVDSSPPQITEFVIKDISTESILVTNEREVTIVMSGSDNRKIYRWLITETSISPTIDQMNSASPAPIISYAIQSPEDGKKSIYAWAMDEAKNISKPIVHEIILDTTAQILIDNVNLCSLKNNKLITGQMDANASVQITCTSATVGEVTYPTNDTFQVQLSDMNFGDNKIFVASVDPLENHTSHKFNIRYSLPYYAEIDKQSDTLLADNNSIVEFSISIFDNLTMPVCDGTVFQITTDIGILDCDSYESIDGNINCNIQSTFDLGTANIKVKFDGNELGSTQIEMIPGPLNRLTFDAREQTITIGEPSSFIKIRIEDAYGHMVPLENDAEILLSSSDASEGMFYVKKFGSYKWCHPGECMFDIPAGTSVTMMKYKSSRVGNPTISISDFDEVLLSDETNFITITSKPPHLASISSEPSRWKNNISYYYYVNL